MRSALIPVRKRGSQLVRVVCLQLLGDEELYAFEDLIADANDLRRAHLSLEQVHAMPGHVCLPITKVMRIIDTSATFGSDAAFARQLRRKFCCTR